MRCGWGWLASFRQRPQGSWSGGRTRGDVYAWGHGSTGRRFALGCVGLGGRLRRLQFFFFDNFCGAAAGRGGTATGTPSPRGRIGIQIVSLHTDDETAISEKERVIRPTRSSFRVAIINSCNLPKRDRFWASTCVPVPTQRHSLICRSARGAR